MTRLLPDLENEKLQAIATSSQYLAERAHCSIEMQQALNSLPSYTKGFEAVFTREAFNILSSTTTGIILLSSFQAQNYDIPLVPSREKGAGCLSRGESMYQVY